jgi:hypothetical protein
MAVMRSLQLLDSMREVVRLVSRQGFGVGGIIVAAVVHA